MWTALVVVVVIDLITKRLAVAYLSPRYIPHPVLGDVLRFTLTYNPGAAFSLYLGPASRWIFIALTVVALGVLAHLYRNTRPGDVPRLLALGLVSGGALGNMLDRLRYAPGVVDFIDIGIGDVRFWTFNVADMGVTIGAALLAWVLWREDVAERAPRGDSESVVP